MTPAGEMAKGLIEHGVMIYYRSMGSILTWAIWLERTIPIVATRIREAVWYRFHLLRLSLLRLRIENLVL